MLQNSLPEPGLSRDLRIPGWKRVLDIVFLIVLLPVIVPLAVGIAVWIRIVSPGPILFHQQRLGFLGRGFTVLQFRTLEVCGQSPSPRRSKFKSGLARAIPCGRFLQASGLNSLPQVLNVWRGEMSLVGPRACLPSEAGHLQAWEKERFNTPPGLTGPWQVSGQSVADWRAMVAADVNYYHRRGPALDCYILLSTLPARLHQIAQQWQEPSLPGHRLAAPPLHSDCHIQRRLALPFNSVPARLFNPSSRFGVRKF